MSDKDDRTQSSLPNVSCPGQIEIPTPKERASLDRMRSIKERVREIRKDLRLLEDSNDEKNVPQVSKLERELESLKEEWDKLEQQWEGDVRDRMIYLGHDEE